MDRPDLISTFTKIELWKQTQYSKIVYIDADAVVLRAPNELLIQEAPFAAVPDVGWPDCFNSGFMALTPNMGDYYSLLALAQRGISFDGADQGLLNMHFRDWERLSFTYNCTPSGNYQYVPAYRHFQSSINVIHFIGQDKPWTLGRYSKKTSGVYDELLGRWWAVYDKHFRPTSVQISGQGRGASSVPHYVTGEAYSTTYGYSSQPPIIPAQHVSAEPASEPGVASLTSAAEQSIADQPGMVETIQRGEYEPTPTVEQRRFSAPMMEWDASRAPPPVQSRPEAENFPSAVYKMSSDQSLFQKPEYPEPPKGMWYEVPKEAPKPEKIEPLFPWEATAPRPTRVFPAEKPKAPSPTIAPTAQLGPESSVAPSTTTDDTASSEGSVSTPTATAPESDPWQAYTRTNAWDEMPEISRYVQSVQRNRQAKVQVLSRNRSSNSPVTPDRRPSLILTDFPDVLDRPSLPVTPAPIRRGSTFWGEERDEAGELPAAEGVPKQEEWVSASIDRLSSLLPSSANFMWRCQYCGKQNPVIRLEELQRKQSEVLEKVSPQSIPEPPKRQMPESASKEEAEAASDRAVVSTTSKSAARRPAPTFKEPTYDSTKATTSTTTTTKEPELAPTTVRV